MIWIITLEKKYCEAILDGRKKIEVRTRIPRVLAAGDMVVVCEKGSYGHVPFYFIVDSIKCCSPRALWVYYKNQLAIEEADYLEYTKERLHVYGICIRKVYKYAAEVAIADFGVYKAPQWFSHVKDVKIDGLISLG